MAILTAEAVAAAKDYEETLVQVPEWGGEVKVRTLSMGARYEMNKRAVKDGKVDNAIFTSATLEFGVVEPKLTRDQAEKIVAERADAPIQRIVDEIWRLSGLKEVDAKKD